MVISELLATLRIAIDRSIVEADTIFDSSCRLLDGTDTLGRVLKTAYYCELSTLEREKFRFFYEAEYSSLKILIWEQGKPLIDVLGKCGVHLDKARMELTALIGQSNVWRAHRVELIKMVKDIDAACQKLHLASIQYSKFYGLFQA